MFLTEGCLKVLDEGLGPCHESVPPATHMLLRLELINKINLTITYVMVFSGYYFCQPPNALKSNGECYAKHIFH